MNYRKKAAAIKYTPPKDNAPVLIAKGAGHVAEKIISSAQKHGIELRQDADLTQALSALDIYSEIPEELYAAAGELLAEIYKINKSAK